MALVASPLALSARAITTLDTRVRATVGHTVVDVRDGLRLSWALPERVYRQNALIRLRLRIDNVSGHPIHVDSACPLPGLSVGIQVVNDSGWVLYPPPLQHLPGIGPCPGGPGRAFAPGSHMVLRTYVVLRARHLRAFASLIDARGHLVTVVGRTVTVALRPAPAPLAHVHIDHGSSSVRVTPPPGVQGPMHYVDSLFCSTVGQEFGESHLTWSRASGRRVSVECPIVLEWDVAAGWLNYPVVTVQYVAPKPSVTASRRT